MKGRTHRPPVAQGSLHVLCLFVNFSACKKQTSELQKSCKNSPINCHPPIAQIHQSLTFSHTGFAVTSPLLPPSSPSYYCCSAFLRLVTLGIGPSTWFPGCLLNLSGSVGRCVCGEAGLGVEGSGPRACSPAVCPAHPSLGPQVTGAWQRGEMKVVCPGLWGTQQAF